MPGHTGIMGRQDLEKRRDYDRDLLAGLVEARTKGLSLEQAQAKLALDQAFPYLSGVKPYRGSAQDQHAANVAAVWRLLAQ